MSKLRPIMVLGMHRSGTSCLTGILQRFGVYLGNVSQINENNSKGNRENDMIMIMNDALLKANGGSWKAPVPVQDWTDEHRQGRRFIIEKLSSDGPDWGFKDPRSLLTLPFWMEALEPRFIGTFRHPLRVAYSLRQRRGSSLSLDDGLKLWYQYNRCLLAVIKYRPFPLVNFDLPAGQYVRDVVAKLLQLGLDTGRADNAVAFFDQQLRTQIQLDVEGKRLPVPVQSLYDELLQTHANGFGLAHGQ